MEDIPGEIEKEFHRIGLGKKIKTDPFRYWSRHFIKTGRAINRGSPRKTKRSASQYAGFIK